MKAVENYTQNSTWAIPINNGAGNHNKTNNNSANSANGLLHQILKAVLLALVVAAEPQLGSTLFLTLHDVLAFSCPVPRPSYV